MASPAGKLRTICMQNENGPCPLLAISPTCLSSCEPGCCCHHPSSLSSSLSSGPSPSSPLRPPNTTSSQHSCSSSSCCSHPNRATYLSPSFGSTWGIRCSAGDKRSNYVVAKVLFLFLFWFVLPLFWFVFPPVLCLVIFVVLLCPVSVFSFFGLGNSKSRRQFPRFTLIG